MNRFSAASALLSIALCSLPLAAQPAASARPATTTGAACDDPACAAPALAKPPTYSAQLERNSDFSVDAAITQPCSCVRHLTFLVAFTAPGAKNSRERTFKLDVPPGTSSRNLLLTHAELAKAKVTPGRYTLAFAIQDEHEHAGGGAVSGLPFSLGSSKEALAAQPIVPKTIARDAELSVPFVFSNSGDIASRVTALLVFTRPDTQTGIELYRKGLVVPPGGSKHVVHLSAAERKQLKIGPGAWLVTVSAFDGGENRLASYPGNLMLIGKVLSLPGAPKAASPIEQAQDLTIDFEVKNDSDADDLVTAVLTFSGKGAPKPIEYKVEGVSAPPGASHHSITLSALDRYNLGIRPGVFHIAVSALDRAGKRVESRRANDVTIHEPHTESAAK